VRIYLQREGYNLVASLPPSRGLAKLVVQDPDDGEVEEGEEGGADDKVLVLVIPRRTTLEPRAWEGEAERNGCQSMLVFAMGEPWREAPGEVRVVVADELARWMVERSIGIEELTVTVPVIDAAFVESVGGLDT
jgi:hypothetical protein